MSVDVRTDEITLPVMALTAIAPDESASYPYGRLESTGRTIDHSFQTVVIENEYLEVTVVPALGGRIVRVRSRSGIDFLPVTTNPRIIVGGKRGIEIPTGIEWVLDGERSMTATGPSSAQLDPAREDAEPGGVWLSQCATGTGLSFHFGIFLDPGIAQLRLEARILNRSWQSVRYNGGLLIDGGLAHWGWHSDTEFQRSDDQGLTRFNAPRMLQPRQVDTWTIQLTPYQPLSADAIKNSEAAIELTTDPSGARVAKIQVAKVQLQARLVVLTHDGQSLESPLDVYPEHRVELPLGDLQVTNAALLLPNGDPIVGGPPKQPNPSKFDSFTAGTRHVAHAAAAMESLGRSDFANAAEQFERSLLYNGDDPLSWWGLAFSRRLASESDLTDGALANAHFLAPLEPILRAEAILSQDQAESTGPNPLLAPLSVTPEAFVVVACQLLETRQFPEASRWLTEAMQHADIPMLHYLLADIYLSETKLIAEAAQHVSQAARLGFQPPFPFAPQEFDALARLSIAFPNDAVLKQFNSLRPWRNAISS